MNEIRQTVSVMSIVARWCAQLARGETPRAMWLVFHGRGSTQPPGYMCAWSVHEDDARNAARAIPNAMLCKLQPSALASPSESVKRRNSA